MLIIIPLALFVNRVYHLGEARYEYNKTDKIRHTQDASHS
jgi:hypothetical protein